MDLIFDFALVTWQIILWGPDLANIIVKSRFYFCGKVKMNHLCLWSLKQKPWIEMGILLRIPDILLLCSFFLFLSIIEKNNYFIIRVSSLGSYLIWKFVKFYSFFSDLKLYPFDFRIENEHTTVRWKDLCLKQNFIPFDFFWLRSAKRLYVEN